MTEQEEMLQKLLQNNPNMMLEDISLKMVLTAFEVNEMILSLPKTGHVMERNGFYQEENQILCIGGANVDRKIQTLQTLMMHTSNPAKSIISCGGVARNIAENLGRLDLKTSLLALVGSDPEGEWLLNHTKALVNIAPTLIIQGKSTGSYTAILDSQGEMVVALADMEIYENIEKHVTGGLLQQISKSKLVLLDTNFPLEINQQILHYCKEWKLPLLVATVSAPKTERLPENLEGVSWLIANKAEAESLSKMEIKSDEDYFLAANAIQKKGVERVVITKGEKGLIYYTKKGEAGEIAPPKLMVTDVTGAGDSLVAGIIFSFLKGLNIEASCKIGISCSFITLQSTETVNPILSQEKLMETFQQYFAKGVYQP